MDDVVLKALTEPGHLVVMSVIIGITLGLFSFGWKFLFPSILAKELRNGAGKQITALMVAAMDAAYIKQHEALERTLKERDRAHSHAIKAAFEDHEKVELLKLELALSKLKSETKDEVLAEVAKRFAAVEA